MMQVITVMLLVVIVKLLPLQHIVVIDIAAVELSHCTSHHSTPPLELHRVKLLEFIPAHAVIAVFVHCFKGICCHILDVRCIHFLTFCIESCVRPLVRFQDAVHD